MRKNSSSLGVGLDEAANSFEKFRRAKSGAGGPSFIVNPFAPGGARLPSSDQAHFDTLTKLFQLGAGNIEGGQKDLNTFLESIKKGRLTGESVQQLSPGSATQIARLFGLPTILPGSNVDPRDLLTRQLGPSGRSFQDLELRLQTGAGRINKEFGEKPVSLGDAFSKLETAAGQMAPSFGGVATAANAAAEALNKIAGSSTAGKIGDALRLNVAPGSQAAGGALNVLLTILSSIVSKAPGHASGGIIRGPGSGTSDSILARVSNGEGIVSAAGMSRLGVAGLDAINGYATGGLVGSFAGGGVVSGGSGRTVDVHLHVGGNAYPAVMRESVAERFVQESIINRMASGGRRQSSIS